MSSSGNNSANGVCPESTIESANRRDFMRRAVLASAAVGVGSTIFALNTNAVSRSDAKSGSPDACPGLKGCSPCVGVLGTSTGCQPVCHYCAIGVKGVSSRWGVVGSSRSSSYGIGVIGQSCAEGGAGLYGIAGGEFAAAIEAQATGSSAYLQYWMVGCCTPRHCGMVASPTIVAAVNHSGWFGIGTSCPATPLDVKGTASISCKVIIGTGTPCATLCVVANGGNIHASGSVTLGYNLVTDHGNNNAGTSLNPGVVFGSSCKTGIASNQCASATSNNQYGLDFYTCGAKRMSITKGGKVGINNVSPSKTFTVCGPVQFSQTSACDTLIAKNTGSGKAICAESSSCPTIYAKNTGSTGATAITAVGSSCTFPAICGTNTHYIGIRGSGGTYGVYGSGLSGVYGTSSAKCAYGVEGVAGAPCTVPLIAIGALKQNYNIAEFAKAVCCSGTKKTDVLSVVNNNGWLGLGATSAPTTLHVGGSISAKMANTGDKNYCMGSSDFAVFACHACVTVTLPAADSATGRIVFIKNTSSGSMTVAPFSGNCIEGSTSSKTLSKPYDSLMLMSNGGKKWVLMGNSIGDAFTS